MLSDTIADVWDSVPRSTVIGQRLRFHCQFDCNHCIAWA